jgi:hypothetical protein
VFESNIVANTNAPRMMDAIALHHTGNLQGNYFFMSLHSGRKVSQAQYTKLPLTQRIIDAVNKMRKLQGQPMLVAGGPKFMLHNNEVFGDSTMRENPPMEAATMEMLPKLPDDSGDDAHAFLPLQLPMMTEQQFEYLHVTEPNHENEENPMEVETIINKGDNEPNMFPNVEPDKQGHEPMVTQGVGADTIVTHNYNLQSERTRNYAHRYGMEPTSQFVQFIQSGTEDRHVKLPILSRHVFDYIMTQMTANAGTKKHGQAAVEALFMELAQLHKQHVFTPMKAEELSQQEKRDAL